MDASLQHFFTACDAAHREFFSALLFDWREAGQIVEADTAGEEEPVVLLRVRAWHPAPTEGQGDAWTMPCLFTLHAGDAFAPPRISLALDRWREWFGAERRDAFLTDCEAISGLRTHRRGDEFAMREPGYLSGPAQKALRQLIIDFARKIREELGF